MLKQPSGDIEKLEEALKICGKQDVKDKEFECLEVEKDKLIGWMWKR